MSYNKKKKHHIEDTARLVLIYSYFTDVEDGEIAINQLAVSKYLDLTKDCVARHFKKFKQLGLVTITNKRKLSTGKNVKWMSNLYSVDLELLNEFIMSKTGEDVLPNIIDEAAVYHSYMSLVLTNYTKTMLAELSDEDRAKYLRRIENKAIKEAEKIENLKNENSFYLNLLNEVNNDIIPMKYLDEGRKRLTNSLCATKNPMNGKHVADRVRTDMLRKIFNVDENISIVEFDTNASIYRLSHALGNNTIINHNNDIYELVFNKCNFSVDWTAEFRNNFKTLLMPIYMLERSIQYKCFEISKQSRWTYFISEAVKKNFLFYKYFIDKLKIDLLTILTTIQKAMHEIFNLDKFFQSEIFIHESNLHIIMLKLFKDLNIKTINVYDGFYFIKNTMTQELYDFIYDKATNILLHNLNTDNKSLLWV